MIFFPKENFHSFSFVNLVYLLTSVQSYTYTPSHLRLSSPIILPFPSFFFPPLLFPFTPPYPTSPLSHPPTILSHSPQESHPSFKISTIPPIAPKPTNRKNPPTSKSKATKKKTKISPLSKSTNPTPRNFPPRIKHQNPSLGNSNSQIPPTIRLENSARENFHQGHFRCKSACCGR